MSTPTTTARTVEQIEADLIAVHDAQRALTAKTEPLLLELLRAQVHAAVADAATVVLYAAPWDNGWFYGDDFEITATDGTVISWMDVIDDPSTDTADGDISDRLLADLSTLYGACESQSTLTVDLVRLKAQTSA